MTLTIHAPPHLRADAELLEKKYSGKLQGHVFATSGSMGAPKWIHHRESGLQSCAEHFNQHFEVTSRDRAARALPDFHVGGFMMQQRAKQRGHELLIFQDKWNAESFVHFLTTHRITLTSLVPTQLHDIVMTRQACPTSLRLVLIGGACLTETLATKARSLGWPIIASYGMTETAGLVACTSPQGFTLHPLQGWQLRTTAHGLLEIAGDGLFAGHLTSQGYLEHSPTWFTTSDLAHYQHGDLHVIGRSDEHIKILGELVNLATLRAQLSEQFFPHITTALALPDARKGHQLVAVVEGPANESLTRGLASFNARQPAFARISEIRSIPHLPKTPLGKIDLTALSKTFSAEY